MKDLARRAARLPDGVLLAFAFLSTMAGVLLITGTFGVMWSYLQEVLITFGQHPTLFAFVATAALAFAGAGFAWLERRQ